jgi:hypothetical protein
MLRRAFHSIGIAKPLLINSVAWVFLLNSPQHTEKPRLPSLFLTPALLLRTGKGPQARTRTRLSRSDQVNLSTKPRSSAASRSLGLSLQVNRNS